MERRWDDLAEELAGLGHWRLDVATREVTWSPNLFRILGFEPADRPPLEEAFLRIHPDDRRAFQQSIDGLLTGESGWEDIRVFLPDGRVRNLAGRASHEHDPSGAVRAAFGVIMDVTDRRRAEAAIADLEIQLHKMGEQTGDVVVHWGPDRTIRYVSPAVRRHGYEPSDLIGRNAEDLIHPDDADKVRGLVREVLSGAASDPTRDRTYRVRLPGDEWRWVEGLPNLVRDETGQPSSVVTLLRDIQDQHATLEALAESEHRYRLLTDNVTDVIGCYGSDGIFTFLAPSIRNLLGYSPEEMVGRRCTNFMHPDDVGRVLRLFAQYLAAGPSAPPIRYEYRAYRKDGSLVWLEAHPRAIYDADGRFVEFQDLVRDVSERRRLEDDLRQARDAATSAARAKAEFLANMSHEIRTPLTAVIGFSSLLAARTDLDPVAKDYADHVVGAGRALLALVNDILDFSKLEAGRVEIKPEAVDPVTLARETLALFELQAAAKDLHLSLEIADDMPATVLTDAKAMGQVLLNLLSNAVKFTDHGSVTLAVRYDAGAARLAFDVSDSGPGLTPDQSAMLFQRFSQVDTSATRRHGGTGLGLAICKGLVEAMNGRIGVQSLPGQGSTFQVQVPAPVIEATPSALETCADDALDLSETEILVVDDNPVNRELVAAVLAPLGVQVTQAVDGPDGLSAAARRPFDLILLDIRMPGMDGRAVLTELRRREGPNRRAPVLAFSADLEAGDAVGANGFDGLVTKPLAPLTLIEAVANWSSRPEETRARRA